MDIKLTSGLTLQTFLDGVIQEGVKSALQAKTLQEKEKQQSSATSKKSSDNSGKESDGTTDLFSDDNSKGDSNDSSTKSSKTMDDESEKLKSGDITTDDIVDKLNSIRAGKSFKDAAISNPMDEYISSLSKPEKVALLAFLKGISQIVTGEVKGDAATEPNDAPGSIDMTKNNTKKVKHLEPNVIKTSMATSKVSKSSKEDTSAPIVAKK